jgi:predicted RNase H-like HicB family nuclease
VLERYVDAAMKHAIVEWIPDDQTYYGHVMRPAAVYVEGNSPAICRRRLRQAVEECLRDMLARDRPIPRIDGVGLRPVPLDDVNL